MNMLIAGGAGFIGSNFIDYMQNAHPDYRIVCLDALTYAGRLASLEEAEKKDGFCFVRADITDKNAVDELFAAEKFDIVVNFAAETHVDRSIEDPSVFLRTNILGTQILMDACLKYDARRFHQVSTDEVYGELPIERPDLLFSEVSPLCPSSPYSASKAAADLLTLSYARTFNLPVSISRCSNNYGPRQFPEKLIPLMIIRALAGKELPIYGRGENIRDWIYVKDHCCAIDAIIQRGRSGQVYNIGGQNERANIEVVKRILAELGKPEDLITYVQDRPGHDLRYAVDAGKMQRELGWQAVKCFDDGIKETVNWYRENKSWWETMLDANLRESEMII